MNEKRKTYQTKGFKTFCVYVLNVFYDSKLKRFNSHKTGCKFIIYNCLRSVKPYILYAYLKGNFKLSI